MIFNDSKYNSDWSTKKLSELGSFSRGISKHRPRNDKILFENGVYPLVQTGDIKKANLFLNTYSQKYSEFGLMQSKLWDSGTLCITIAANIAESAILEYPMCFPDSIVGFNSYEDQSTELFMYYIFEFIKNSIRKSSSGSTQDNINIDYLTSLHFKIPELKIQNKITNLLSIIDKKIIINNKINDNLYKQVHNIYDYWFIQFEFPNRQGIPYRSSNGIFNKVSNYKHQIPFGWTVESVAYNRLSTLIKPGVDEFKEKFYLATADIKGTEISKGTLIEFHNRESRANMQPTLNSVWFAKMKNSVKHLFINNGMNNIINNYILSTGFCGIQCSEISFEYIASFISSTYFETYKDTLAHGATQQAVNNDDLGNIDLVIPDDNTLRSFHEIIKPIYDQISINHCENQHLINLREFLLPMLMNGQVTVDN